MQFYSASAITKILQDSLQNLERADPNDPAVKRLKRALLLRLAELEVRKDEVLRTSPRSTV